MAVTGVPLNKCADVPRGSPSCAGHDAARGRTSALQLPWCAGVLVGRIDEPVAEDRDVAGASAGRYRMVHDFHLNLLSWSVQNVVAAALSERMYIWRVDTGAVVQIGEAPEGTYLSLVDFFNDDAFIGIGAGSGKVELWDVESGQKLDSMSGHLALVAALGWYGHLLSSACGDMTIRHHDVRTAQHKVMGLLGYT